MSEFKNVTVIKQASVYFDGKVTSRTLKFSDGSHKTLGIMQAGGYEFGTAQKEIMEILSGELNVLLPETTEWVNIKGGEQFEIPANAKFKVEVITLTDYCCSYVAS
ncbi:pyrimidine/purine nucleoside phosphorylase [Aliivibrio kagoshimensis]|uniref:pyrimidine/purine nucleoside phosphorylase n=1 Tax=Aliivibrio kagoshimensis TaxID=2910230 RepID=UPI003D0B0DAA